MGDARDSGTQLGHATESLVYPPKPQWIRRERLASGAFPDAVAYMNLFAQVEVLAFNRKRKEEDLLGEGDAELASREGLQRLFQDAVRGFPPATSAAVERTVIEGVVDEFRDDEAVVILDIDGQDVTRFMDAEDLRKSGVANEGQSFELHGEEGVRDNVPSLTTWIVALSGPTVGDREEIFPDLDVSKFRRQRDQK